CRLLPVLIIMLAALFTPALQSQVPAPVPVEISKQKIASEGRVYYIHQVMKGQTLYSISRAYNVTVDQVSRENVLHDNGIQVGQMLRIPVNGGSQVAVTQTATKPKEQTEPQSASTRPGLPSGS
ncbi:MAG: LysM peptidoglycan-binding domain-containing protein, partial [Bacteroidales bacterium]